jgi:hypothetical protein
MERTSAIKMHRNYTMKFKVLKHVKFEAKTEFLEGLDTFLDDALDAIDTARGIFLRLGDIVSQIESTYESTVLEALRKTSLMMKALQGSILTAADLGPNIMKKTMTAAEALDFSLSLKRKQKDQGNSGSLDSRLSKSQVRFPNNMQQAVNNNGTEVISTIFKGDSLQAVDSSELPLSATNALIDEQAAAVELSRTFFEDVRDDLKRIRDNAADQFNLGDEVFDTIFNRVPTLTGDDTKEFIDDEYDVLNGFNLAVKGLNLFLSTNTAFKSDYPDRISDVVDKFGGNINLQSEQAVKEIPLPTDITLEQLALRELADPDRWIEIVELNGLKPPYITQNRTESSATLRAPGDKIYMMV